MEDLSSCTRPSITCPLTTERMQRIKIMVILAPDNCRYSAYEITAVWKPTEQRCLILSLGHTSWTNQDGDWTLSHWPAFDWPWSAAVSLKKILEQQWCIFFNIIHSFKIFHALHWLQNKVPGMVVLFLRIKWRRVWFSDEISFIYGIASLTPI